MTITILPAAPPGNAVQDDYDRDEGGVDLEGDVDMLNTSRPAKKARLGMVTPGETVTDDPQWMRYASIPIYSRLVGELMSSITAATAPSPRPHPQSFAAP